MKKFVYPLLVILVAIVSVGISEVTLVTWLNMTALEVTANIFWLGILPAQLLTVGIATLILMVIFKHNPKVYLPIYGVVFAGLHAYELNSLFNPPQDILLYMTVIVIGCALWFSLLWRFYLRDHA